MDDLSEKLAGILNDPESMEQVRKMAESLLSENEKTSSEKTESDQSFFSTAQEMQAIMSLISHFKNAGDDQRTKLINALKPYLSEPRREKADTAIKILKILEMLPLIKDSGLFKI